MSKQTIGDLLRNVDNLTPEEAERLKQLQQAAWEFAKSMKKAAKEFTEGQPLEACE